MQTCELCGKTEGTLFAVRIDNERHTFCEACLDRGGFAVPSWDEVARGMQVGDWRLERQRSN